MKEYKRRLLQIAVPIMLSNLISQVQMLIDRIFLGQVNTLYMSALGNVTSPMWTTMSFAFTITAGASILISQNIGAGDKDKVKQVFSLSLRVSAALGILFSVVTWFFPEAIMKMFSTEEEVIFQGVRYLRISAFIYLLKGNVIQI